MRYKSPDGRLETLMVLVLLSSAFDAKKIYFRNIVKYNLASARMTAWTHVSESVYKSETPFTWRGHSWITMSVDKRGLWASIPGPGTPVGIR